MAKQLHCLDVMTNGTWQTCEMVVANSFPFVYHWQRLARTVFEHCLLTFLSSSAASFAKLPFNQRMMFAQALGEPRSTESFSLHQQMEKSHSMDDDASVREK